jgi:hypothetical protein
MLLRVHLICKTASTGQNTTGQYRIEQDSTKHDKMYLREIER